MSDKVIKTADAGLASCGGPTSPHQLRPHASKGHRMRGLHLLLGEAALRYGGGPQTPSESNPAGRENHGDQNTAEKDLS